MAGSDWLLRTVCHKLGAVGIRNLVCKKYLQSQGIVIMSIFTEFRRRFRGYVNAWPLHFLHKMKKKRKGFTKLKNEDNNNYCVRLSCAVTLTQKKFDYIRVMRAHFVDNAHFIRAPSTTLTNWCYWLRLKNIDQWLRNRNKAISKWCYTKGLVSGTSDHKFLPTPCVRDIKWRNSRSTNHLKELKEACSLSCGAKKPRPD